MHDTDLERDAAIAAEAKFAPEQYRKVEGVCVFCEHEREHNGETLKFDLAELERICNANNNRIVDTGSFSPLIEGHVSDDPDADEKPVLGFQGPYRLSRIGSKKPRWAIVCDEYHKLKHADKLDDLPRRSPELWIEKKLIDPVAALGGTTPHMDLGLAFRTQGRQLKYSAPVVAAGSNTYVPDETSIKNRNEESDMDPEQLVEAVMQTDTMQRMTALLPALEEMVQAQQPNAPEPEPVIEPEAEPVLSQEDDEEEPKIESAAGIGEDEVEKYKREAKEAKLKFARMERDHKEMQTTVNKIVRDKTDDARTAKLDELSLRFAMDPDAENKRCLFRAGAKMTDEQFDSHVELIETNYQRLPVHEDRMERVARFSAVHSEFENDQPPHAAPTRIKGTPGIGEKDRVIYERAKAHATKIINAGGKITFEQAVEAVKSKDNGDK